MTREALGEFEHLVLLACVHLGRDAYTVGIVQEIEARTGRSVQHSAAYVALRRLEKRGLVRSELGEPTPERGGRAKRFFRVQPEAWSALVASREALLAMWEGIDPTPGAAR
ncbi:MAG: PadR family transcriptional regulator [Gemmatimonadota bacterium]